MKKITVIKICLIASLLISSSVFAKSSLWKISKGSDHLFIGGTIHLLSKDDYPLPADFEKIYSQSEELVLETDMQKLQQPEIQMKMLQQMSYQDGATLKEHLKPETYTLLEDFISTSGLPMQAIESYKPGMVSMMLTVIELKKLGIDVAGVDQFYTNKAMNDQKKLGKLETVEQQMSFLASMGQSDPDGFIRYTLRDMTELPKMFNDLKIAWKNGDTKKLAEIAIIPMKKDFPETYQALLVKRNKAWVPQIEKMLKTKEIEMILVGALHLAGKESVLTQLESLGYEVEQY